MPRFSIEPTPLADLFVVRRERRGDERGFFSRFFCRDELTACGWTREIVQINHTYTAETGTVRGMHFQRAPHAETKFVSCLRGRVFDVAVDLRAGSPTRGRWFGTELGADNATSLMIPRGFAHGFQTLEADCELIYLHDAPHVAEAEGGVNAFDPGLAVVWPLPASVVSPRDRGLPGLDQVLAEGV